MGKKKRMWSKKEEKFLRKNYRAKFDWEIADELGVSRKALYDKRLAMNLKRQGEVKSQWDKKKQEYLENNFNERAEDLCRTLRVSYSYLYYKKYLTRCETMKESDGTTTQKSLKKTNLYTELKKTKNKHNLVKLKRINHKIYQALHVLKVFGLVSYPTVEDFTKPIYVKIEEGDK